MNDHYGLKGLDLSAGNTLDDFFAKTQGMGSLEKAGTNSMYGINFAKTAALLPQNTDTQGHIFFPRPQLNLSDFNCKKLRTLFPLLTNDPTSIHRYIRCILDPRQIADPRNGITCPLIDNKLAFMPLLSNMVKTATGWQDLVLPTYTSKEGVRKEQYSQVDGSIDILSDFDIDCVFKNMKGDPTLMLIVTWLINMSSTFENILSPYKDMAIAKEKDYNTRIYRMVMDESNKYVTQFACTGASYPVNAGTGKVFDLDKSAYFANQNKEINVRFRSTGCRYNDPIILSDFNETSAIFNPGLGDVIDGGFKPRVGHNFDLIPSSLKTRLNYRGYPLVNTDTYELGWWLDTRSLAWKEVEDEIRLLGER